MERIDNGAEWWPKAAASMAVFKGDRVLLAERGKGVAPGRWSLPGGHIEPGEPAREAALREIMEETSITADIVGLVDIHDVIHHNLDGSVRVHYLITVFCGVWMSGEPTPGDDCRQARFVTADEIHGYDLTDRTATIIEAARRIVRAAGR